MKNSLATISKIKVIAVTTALFALGLANAHDFKLGDLVIDHPYATPTVSGAPTGGVYFRAIKNNGKTSDRLISATTPAAAKVELHEVKQDNGVMFMREVAAIDLPAGTEIHLRHGQKHHLMLIELKKPLAVGDRFDLTLKFEKAGEKTVGVVVQQPKGDGGHRH